MPPQVLLQVLEEYGVGVVGAHRAPDPPVVALRDVLPHPLTLVPERAAMLPVRAVVVPAAAVVAVRGAAGGDVLEAGAEAGGAVPD